MIFLQLCRLQINGNSNTKIHAYSMLKRVLVKKEYYSFLLYLYGEILYWHILINGKGSASKTRYRIIPKLSNVAHFLDTDMSLLIHVPKE